MSEKSVEEVMIVIDKLLESIKNDPGSWENNTLDGYLRAMRAWLEDSKSRIGERPSWSFISDMLMAGKIYE